MSAQAQSNGALLDKFKGALAFSAVGDALGWPTEFGHYPAATKKQSGRNYLDDFVSWQKLVGGRYWGYRETIEEGAYSDDTQLTLAVYRCIDESGKFNPERFAYFELPLWLHYERGGGRTIKMAARKLNQTSKEWIRNFYSTKELSYRNAGANGAAMRVLPIALTNAFSLNKLRSESFLNAIVTHGHPRAIVGCILYAAAIWFLLRERELSVSPFLEFLRDSLDFEPENNNSIQSWIEEWNKHPLDGKSFQETLDATKNEVFQYLNQIKQNGNSHDNEFYALTGALTNSTRGSGTTTVGVAIFLLCKYSADPTKALLTAVNMLGSDTDTISGFLGGLLGALHGVSAVPPKLFNRVQDKDYILKTAMHLHNVVTGQGSKDYATAEDFDRRDAYLKIMAWEIGLHELFWDALDAGDSIVHPALGRGEVTAKRIQPLMRSDYQAKLIHVSFESGQTCVFHSRVSKDGRLSESLAEDTSKALQSLKKMKMEKTGMLVEEAPGWSLEKFFELENQNEVNQLLRKHKELIRPLFETSQKIREIFSNHAVKIVLKMDKDTEEHYEGLSVIIETDIEPKRSLDLLDRFDNEWWLDVDETTRMLVTVMVQPV
ncbi:ADP-ribosylglycohydrolase family protein [bacterium]|nr:ADP-ribosylglycohydrolase family protein [bacterium]